MFVRVPIRARVDWSSGARFKEKIKNHIYVIIKRILVFAIVLFTHRPGETRTMSRTSGVGGRTRAASRPIAVSGNAHSGMRVFLPRELLKPRVLASAKLLHTRTRNVSFCVSSLAGSAWFGNRREREEAARTDVTFQGTKRNRHPSDLIIKTY